MRNYELVLIASLTTPEAQFNDSIQEFISWLQDQGGIFMNQNTQGKRVLPSGIQKQKEGLLVSLHFALDPEKTKLVEQKAKDTALILRSMLIIAPIRKVQAPTPVGVASGGQEALEKENVQEQAQAPADAGDIDKKLEEIFKGEGT
jgi:ribosomal protein S6